jgi:DNA (cytosine-5)-methyltransferase 1
LPEVAPPSTGWRLASFFCCAGGFDLGFRSAGVEPAFANDIDPDAVAAFTRNIGHAPLHRDIRGVGADDWGTAPFDVVTGGFPCVTFSMAGQRAGVTDDLHGKLYLELCRVIGAIRPRYFVAENVRGILSANGGAAVKLVQAAFLRLGYRASYELVNMAEHGVPQTRERVIFVGVRLDQWRGSFVFPKKTHRLRDDKHADKWLPLARSLRDAIGDLPLPGERLKMQTHEGGATYAALGKPPTVGYGYSRPRAPIDPSHSQTTSPNVLHVGTNDAVGHPLVDGMRRMTVRECARVQSFPDWFEYPASQSAGYKLVGNAVPPLYAKRLALALLEYDERPVAAR